MAFTFMELLARFRRHVGDFDYKHSILNLAGFPGGTTTFLRADGSFASAVADLSADQQTGYWHHTYSGEYAPPETTVTGTGAVGVIGGGFMARRYSTGATSASTAGSRTVIGNSGGVTAMSIGKVRRLELDVVFGMIDANTTAYCFLTSESATGAPSLTSDHIGLKNVAGVVRFTTADGTTEQTTDISAFVTAAKDHTYVTTFDGTTAKLYIDGTLRATHATNVPRSSLAASLVLRGYITNSAATNKVFDITRIDALFVI